jgi:hypothetical protein
VFLITLTDEAKTKIEWMKHNTQPEEQVRAYMKETVLHRRKFIHPPQGTKAPSLDDIMNQYPRLMDPGMVSLAYIMHPHTPSPIGSFVQHRGKSAYF